MTNILDHAGITVMDFDRSKAFFVAALGTLRIQLLVDFAHEGHRHAGFGIARPSFWIGEGRARPGGIHLAFLAKSRSEVKSFYTVALAVGGRDNGAPGLRAHYHPDYFGAYVFDPDGNNIEAVCHGAE